MSYNFKILPVVLSGGIGSRLWPISRKLHPKPFIKMQDNQSFLQKTYLRATSLPSVDEILTVTNRELFFYTKDEYREVDISHIHQSFILEPMGKGSAAAIALSALYAISKGNENIILLVLPSDHLIKNLKSFENAITEACRLAENDKIVTFGIKAKSPSTEYGYIEADGNEVKRFVEKPPIEKAREYLESGNYYWNSGMFCAKPESIINEMRLYCPEVLSNAENSFNESQMSEGDVTQIEIPSQHFEEAPNISIDFAVIEKSKNVAVVPCDIGWSDVGSWNEFGKLHPCDTKGNHILGETILENVENCIIHSKNKMIAGIGLNNLVIVDAGDAVLVSDKNYVQDVKKVVKTLEEQNHEIFHSFETVYRPWGSYTVLQEEEGFKIKRIEVKPGASLSLQSHNHRSEHWVVVSGVAKVINGNESLELQSNQSTYIPVGVKHRLENFGTDLLVLIEVQCGDYLGEDDIIRYEDIYKRK